MPYTVRYDDDGGAAIVFGDGKTGRRGSKAS
jgi:hypothetical protein